MDSGTNTILGDKNWSLEKRLYQSQTLQEAWERGWESGRDILIRQDEPSFMQHMIIEYAGKK